MSAEDYGKNRFGRIDVPCFPPNTPGNPSRQVMRLGVTGGKRADTDPTQAPVSDVNNFVMLPDGSGMRIRDGFAYTDRYAIQTSPTGRQALMVETAPWNVNDSYRHMILPTGAGIPYVSEGEYVRDRSQSLQFGNSASVYFLATAISEAPPGPLFNNATLIAVGPNPIDVTVKYQTFDGTAIAGVDYTAETGSITLPANSLDFPLDTGIGINVSGIGKYFFVALSSQSSLVTIGNPGVLQVNIV